MKVQIKNGIGTVLFETEADSQRDAVLKAVKTRAYLSGANLSRADLLRADLSGADLSGVDLSGANLSRANLSRANLSRANLSRADLSGANLSGAYLSGANLSGANLSRANLSRADLSGANLSRAIGVAPELVCDLLILKDQVGEMVSYKLTNAQNEGIYSKSQGYGALEYADAVELSVSDASTDTTALCSSGINVGTLAWILKHYEPGYRVKVIHHTAADIACIPTATDGKYRLFRCKVGTKEENEAITERVAKLYESMQKKD